MGFFLSYNKENSVLTFCDVSIELLGNVAYANGYEWIRPVVKIEYL